MIVDAAIEVHRELGPGLLESTYEECLCYELGVRRLQFERQVELPVRYNAVQLDCGYRMDIVVECLVLIELKSVDSLAPIHTAQTLTYLRLSHLPLGLLINFNVPLMKEGIRRLAHRMNDPQFNW
ncbi:GxxExxY protein [bacterium]|nr:MAG: GxxExxY protein [bacterium]